MSEIRPSAPDPAHDENTHGSDRAWVLGASGALAGLLVFAGLLAFVIVPVVQGQAAGIDPWTAICRATGLLPGSPARAQPTSSALAEPVSDVAWRPEILDRIAHADRKAGEKIAADVCSACHGDGGVSPDPTYPFLAGQSSAAIYKQLHDYKSGARKHELMTPVVQKLSEEQMVDVAAYFSKGNAFGSLGPRWPVPDPEIQAIAETGISHRNIPACNACHGSGVGGPIETPTLTGQHEEYILRQLHLYAAAERKNDVYARMRSISARLTEDEKKRLAAYYQGLR